MKSKAIDKHYLNEINFPELETEFSRVRISKFRLTDGRDINLYQIGDPNSEKLILLPPYGISYLMLLKLASKLSSRFYVLSWESIGCPDPSVDFQDSDCDLTSQASNFMNIIEHQGFDDFHMVGWCQAAQLSVHLITKQPIRPLTMTWLAPAGLGCASKKSEFERCGLSIYLDIEKQGIKYAEKLAKILGAYLTGGGSSSSIADAISMLHLSNPEMTFRFSKYMKQYEDGKTGTNALLNVFFESQSVKIIHSRDDNYSHYSESTELNDKYSNVSLNLLETGGHLGLFNNATQVAELITNYIMEKTECPEFA